MKPTVIEQRRAVNSIDWLGETAIPVGWAVGRLGYVARFRSGDAIDASRISADGPFPVYGGGGLRGFTDCYNAHGSYPMIGRQGALCGKVWTGEGKFFATEHAIVAYPGPGAVAKWLAYVLAVMNLGQYSTSAAQPGISIDVIVSKKVPVPPAKLQRAVADYLDRETAQIDAFIAKSEELISLLAERRASVIAQEVRADVTQGGPARQTNDLEVTPALPDGWTVQRLKSTIAASRNGIWGDDPEGGNDDIRCVRVADFDRVRQRIHDGNATDRKVSASERRGRVLQEGDLLIEKSGGGEKSPVGFVVLYNRREPAVCSNFVARIQLAEGMDPRFWTYTHGALYRQRITERSAKQSTGIQNLDQSSYFSEYVAVPPLTEQVRVADYLDTATSRIDAAIATATRAIELARERRSALISAAVTGKIDVGVAA